MHDRLDPDLVLDQVQSVSALIRTRAIGESATLIASTPAACSSRAPSSALLRG